MHDLLRSRVRTILAAAVLGAATAGLATPASAETLPQGGGANNLVRVSTTSDGAARARAHVQLAHAGGPTVASANIAAATAASCTGCHSNAVAVQVVFVTGGPRDFRPANVATAANLNCSACSTFAYAWQYVLQVDGPVHLSTQGERRVRALAHAIDATAASTFPKNLDEALALDARLDALTTQLEEVVQEEAEVGKVEPAGPPKVLAHTSYRPANA
jgi:hypothetical protein